MAMLARNREILEVHTIYFRPMVQGQVREDLNIPQFIWLQKNGTVTYQPIESGPEIPWPMTYLVNVYKKR